MHECVCVFIVCVCGYFFTQNKEKQELALIFFVCVRVSLSVHSSALNKKIILNKKI